jgi:ribosomal protein L14E/L6E/L27E
MTEGEFQIGRVVLAKAGRDKGHAFIIIKRLDDDYVLIADGVGRTIDKPKKKKTKHLTPKPFLVKELKDKIEDGKQVLDADIRKSLKSLGYER